MGNQCCSNGTLLAEQQNEFESDQKIISSQELSHQRLQRYIELQNDDKQKKNYTNEKLKINHGPSDKLGRILDESDSAMEQYINKHKSQKVLITEQSLKNFLEILMENNNILKGYWSNGKRNGFGELLYKDGSYFIGFWKEDQVTQYGRMIHADGSYYEGMWVDDKMQGQGEYKQINPQKWYNGDWINDQQHGYGEEIYEDQKQEYKGQFQFSQKHGKGVYKWADGSIYIGEFKHNLMLLFKIDGKGQYIWPDKREYNGEWFQGKMNGRGTFKWQDGRQYVGDYLDDKKHGQGQFDWPDGRRYVGQFVDGKMSGIGYFYIIKKNQQTDEIELEKSRQGEWDNGVFKQWIGDLQEKRNNQDITNSYQNQDNIQKTQNINFTDQQNQQLVKVI